MIGDRNTADPEPKCLGVRGHTVNIYLAGQGANIELAVSKTTKKISVVVVVRYDAS